MQQRKSEVLAGLLGLFGALGLLYVMPAASVLLLSMVQLGIGLISFSALSLGLPVTGAVLVFFNFVCVVLAVHYAAEYNNRLFQPAAGKAPKVDCCFCSTAVEQDDDFCPSCGNRVRGVCAQCQKPHRIEAMWCSGCGSRLRWFQVGTDWIRVVVWGPILFVVTIAALNATAPPQKPNSTSASSVTTAAAAGPTTGTGSVPSVAQAKRKPKFDPIALTRGE